MKFLITINCSAQRGAWNAVFLYAWGRFIRRNHSLLKEALAPHEVDFLIVNNGIPDWMVSEATGGTSKFKVPRLKTTVWDTDCTYYSIVGPGEGYTYILRFDHDAFPTREHLEAIMKFLTVNQSVDFLTATNYPRTIDRPDNNVRILDNSGTSDKLGWPWLPWKHPTYNGDFFAIKECFFREALRLYRKLAQCSLPGQCPLDTWSMSFGQICDLLDQHDFPEASERAGRIKIDGSICTDFWTCMMILNPVIAGITDEGGRSFKHRGSFIRYPATATFGIDSENTVHKMDLEVVAPYLHLGNGYLAEWYFVADRPEGKHDAAHFLPHFHSPMGTYPKHYSVIRLLTEACGARSDFQARFRDATTNTFRRNNVNTEELEQIYEQTSKLVAIDLKDYLS